MNALKLLVLLPVLCFALLPGHAQEKKAKRDSTYLKYPEMPAFNILLQDSFTVLNTFNIPKGRPSMLMLFDPECKHCKAQTEELVKGMDSISNIDIYFITPVHDFGKIRAFYKEYQLEKYPNVKAIGRDYEFFFASYYDVNFVPDMALYDAHKKILHLFESHVSIKDLYDYTHR